MTPRRRSMVLLLVAAIAGFGLAAGMALAKTHTVLKTANNATLGRTIVVDSRGLTVYTLSGERSHHLKCKKAGGCFANWPPVTVASAKTKLKAGPGVKGKLRILRRSGILQVTLDGHPLYRFVGDGSKKGKAAGEGITAFGGTWHVVTATKSMSTTTSTTTTNPPPPGY
jgi:predicted lipoprotein with Yx(FWY)xxD motif